MPQAIVDELTKKLGKSELSTADWLHSFDSDPTLIDRIVAKSELFRNASSICAALEPLIAKSQHIMLQPVN